MHSRKQGVLRVSSRVSARVSILGTHICPADIIQRTTITTNNNHNEQQLQQTTIITHSNHTKQQPQQISITTDTQSVSSKCEDNTMGSTLSII